RGREDSLQLRYRGRIRIRWGIPHRSDAEMESGRMTNEIRIEPANVDAARSDIERTRERMSETIDEIENVLLRKREEIRSRLDLLGRARERPFVAVGIAAGSGLLLGLLTGGRTKGRT